MDIWIKIGFEMIVLYLVTGFAWLINKLSPTKKDIDDQKDRNEISNSY